MKIAIHKSARGMSHDWLSWCEKNDIPHKIVNCYASDIVEQLKDCDALMWHHHHLVATDAIMAKPLLFALQQAGGIKVCPDFNTGWHFDDKVGEKYLLEQIGAPIAPTWVFYEKDEALRWIDTVSFPKVFKLRGGAGSSNVQLVRDSMHARQLVKRAFGKGFSSYNRLADFKERARKFKWDIQSCVAMAKCARRLFVSTRFARTVGPQKGYVLFQEFIEGNKYDIRILVIGERACAFKRTVRKNDFRASGSGLLSHDKEEIDERCVEIAFQVAQKLRGQCVAFDFVFDRNMTPLIVEISYGFDCGMYLACPGYWDNELKWHEGHFIAAEWMVEDVVRELKNSSS